MRNYMFYFKFCFCIQFAQYFEYAGNTGIL